MPITEQQRAERHKYLGASEQASLWQLDPFREEHKTWLEKVQPDAMPQTDTSYTRMGNRLEPFLIDELESRYGIVVSRNLEIFGPYPMVCHPDGAAMLDGKPVLVQAKTSNIDGFAPERDEFGEDGSDEVPKRVILQEAHELVCAGIEFRIVLVPVLIGGVGFRIYRLHRNDELCAAVEERSKQWWTDYVETKTPPPGTPPLSVLKFLKRMEGKSVNLSDQLILDWLAVREERLRKEKEEKIREAEMLAALGDAEIGLCSFGQLTYKQQFRKAYEIKETSFRVARFKEAKP